MLARSGRRVLAHVDFSAVWHLRLGRLDAKVLRNLAKAAVSENPADLQAVMAVVLFGARGLLRDLIDDFPAVSQWTFHYEGSARDSVLKAGSRVTRSAQEEALLVKFADLQTRFRNGDLSARGGLTDVGEILMLMCGCAVLFLSWVLTLCWWGYRRLLRAFFTAAATVGHAHKAFCGKAGPKDLLANASHVVHAGSLENDHLASAAWSAAALAHPENTQLLLCNDRDLYLYAQPGAGKVIGRLTRDNAVLLTEAMPSAPAGLARYDAVVADAAETRAVLLANKLRDDEALVCARAELDGHQRSGDTVTTARLTKAVAAARAACKAAGTALAANKNKVYLL